MTHTHVRSPWLFMVIAAAILMITMGARQSMGLFVSPLNTHTGLGIATISLAMAIGQFVWGVSQPIFGAMADRWGPVRVIALGAPLLAAGSLLTTQVTSEWGLIFALGVLSAAGAGAGSFSILIGATAQHLPPERRAFASGFINAGGSFGQFVFAPLNQAVMSAFGWMQALWMMAVAALATAPLAWLLGGKAPAPAATPVVAGSASAPVPAPPTLTLREQLRFAARDRSYWCLHAGFFTCGFHIAFLVTHLPGEVDLCGLNAAGGGHVAGDHRAGQHRRQPHGRRVGQPRAHEDAAVLDVLHACARGAGLLGVAQDRVDLLCLRSRARRHLARHRAAHRGPHRQAVRHPLPGHACSGSRC